MDHLGLVKAIDRLGQSVVIAVADTADRRFDARFGEAFGVRDRNVLAAAIGVMDETAAVRWSAIVECLLECVEDEAGMGRAACPPPGTRVCGPMVVGSISKPGAGVAAVMVMPRLPDPARRYVRRDARATSHTPALERATRRDDQPGAIAALRRSLGLEAACSVVVLAIVAWLGTLEPVVSTVGGA